MPKSSPVRDEEMTGAAAATENRAAGTRKGLGVWLENPIHFRSRSLMSYARFAAMIAVSTVVMYGLMYLNTFAFDHVWFSQTRVWMALLMGAVMAVIMLGFMLKMYPNRRANAAIAAGAVVVFT